MFSTGQRGRVTVPAVFNGTDLVRRAEKCRYKDNGKAGKPIRQNRKGSRVFFDTDTAGFCHTSEMQPGRREMRPGFLLQRTVGLCGARTATIEEVPKMITCGKNYKKRDCDS